jgi:hypothetical protein
MSAAAQVRVATDLIAVPRLSSSQALELSAWRGLGDLLAPVLEEALATQGDRADPRVVTLQHMLAELRGPQCVIDFGVSAPTQPGFEFSNLNSNPRT